MMGFSNSIPSRGKVGPQKSLNVPRIARDHAWSNGTQTRYGEQTTGVRASATLPESLFLKALTEGLPVIGPEILEQLPRSWRPGLRVHGGRKLVSLPRNVGRISLAKLDSYGPNRFGALSARPEV